MCNRLSLMLTPDGRILDGYGCTNSHRVICALHGIVDGVVNAYEWQPPAGWPDADWRDGLTEDLVMFNAIARYPAIEAYLRERYPDMDAWERGDPVRLPSDVTEFPDDLVVMTGDAVLPSLRSVSGGIWVREGATLTLPSLVSSGDIWVETGATFTAPALVSSGGLWVETGATFTAPALESVSGYISVREGATFTAPALTSVSGDIRVWKGATLTLPALVSSGDISVRESATLTAPRLRSVSGEISVETGATLTVPALTSSGYL